MKRTLFTISGALLVIALFALFLFTNRVIGLSHGFGNGTALAQEKGPSKAIFKVKCYDDGKSALQGLNGIQKIETGFHYLHETDTVYYDPKVITTEEMESALKKAGTYVETIPQKERN